MLFSLPSSRFCFSWEVFLSFVLAFVELFLSPFDLHIRYGNCFKVMQASLVHIFFLCHWKFYPWFDFRLVETATSFLTICCCIEVFFFSFPFIVSLSFFLEAGFVNLLAWPVKSQNFLDRQIHLNILVFLRYFWSRWASIKTLFYLAFSMSPGMKALRGVGKWMLFNEWIYNQNIPAFSFWFCMH